VKFKRTIKQIKGDLGTIDIAPLIDIVFQLLIFFMLTSSFIFQPGIKVNLPKVITSQVLSEGSVIITITSENLVYIGDELIDKQQLKKKLEEALVLKRPIMIKADKKAALGRVVEIWDMCRSLGLPEVNLATNVAIE